MPTPPRTTVLSLIWYAKPTRGWKLFLSAFQNPGVASDANCSPPRGLKADTGTWGIGLAAYAAFAAAAMLMLAFGSKPRTFRFWDSVVAPSSSYRRPRFTVSRFDTFQSSWTNTPLNSV